MCQTPGCVPENRNRACVLVVLVMQREGVGTRPRNKQVNRWWDHRGWGSRHCAGRWAQLHLAIQDSISKEGVCELLQKDPRKWAKWAEPCCTSTEEGLGKQLFCGHLLFSLIDFLGCYSLITYLSTHCPPASAPPMLGLQLCVTTYLVITSCMNNLWITFFLSRLGYEPRENPTTIILLNNKNNP